jgi:hypothetical protein
VVSLAFLAAVGYALVAGGGGGQQAAGIAVMAAAVALGVVQGYRDRAAHSLAGAAALVAGGGYGATIAAGGGDPFGDGIVLVLVVAGLLSGLFDAGEA